MMLMMVMMVDDDDDNKGHEKMIVMMVMKRMMVMMTMMMTMNLILIMTTGMMMMMMMMMMINVQIMLTMIMMRMVMILMMILMNRICFDCHGSVPELRHMGETVDMRRRYSKLTAYRKFQQFVILFHNIFERSFVNFLPCISASIQQPLLPGTPHSPFPNIVAYR